MDQKLILYGSPYSTCTNTVLSFFKAEKIEFEFKAVNLREGEQKSEEYTKLNPLQKVPVLVEGDLVLRESMVFLRYICNSRQVSDHWYPKDPKKRALVDLGLEYWSQNVGRFFAYALVALKKSDLTKEKAKEISDGAYQDLGKLFLKDTKFVAGDEVTLADLPYLFYYIGQTNYSDYKLENNERVSKWIEDIYATEPAIKQHADDYNKIFQSK